MEIYYQWGRNHDGHQDSTSATIAIQANDVNNAGGSFITPNTSPYDWTTVDSDGIQRAENWSKTDGTSVCPAGFRVPTLDELDADTIDSGVIDSDTAFLNFLKLPLAGLRIFDGAIPPSKAFGSVWSSSTSGFISLKIDFYFDGAETFSISYRSSAYPVRCIMD